MSYELLTSPYYGTYEYFGVDTGSVTPRRIGMSSSGSHVIGYDYGSSNPLKTWRWSPGSGFEYIPLPIGETDIDLISVSGDGNVICGNANDTLQVFRWIDGVGITLSGFLSPDGDTMYQVNWEEGTKSISDDGSTIIGVGTKTSTGGTEYPWYWTVAGGLQEIPLPPSSTGAEPYNVSDDGQYIFCYVFFSTYETWGRWSVANGWELMTVPVGHLVTGELPRITPDGSIAVGTLYIGAYNTSKTPFRWTVASDTVDMIPGLPTGYLYGSTVTGVSDDGNTLVGNSWPNTIYNNPVVPWYWTSTGGTVLVSSELAKLKLYANPSYVAVYFVSLSSDGKIVNLDYGAGRYYLDTQRTIWNQDKFAVVATYDIGVYGYELVGYHESRDGLISCCHAYGLPPTFDDYLVYMVQETYSDTEYVTLKSTVEELLERADLQPTQYDTSALTPVTKPVRAMAVSQITSIRNVLEMLMGVYYFEVKVSDKIYFSLRGGSPAAVINEVDLSVTKDGVTPLFQKSDIELSSQVSIGYINVLADCNNDIQISDRLVSVLNNTVDAIEIPIGLIPSEAKGLADSVLLDRASSLVTSTVVLPEFYPELEPTDVIIIQDKQGSSYRFRILKKSDVYPQVTLELIMDDATILETGYTSDDYAATSTVEVAADTELAQ